MEGETKALEEHHFCAAGNVHGQNMGFKEEGFELESKTTQTTEDLVEDLVSSMGMEPWLLRM